MGVCKLKSLQYWNTARRTIGGLATTSKEGIGLEEQKSISRLTSGGELLSI